MSESAIHRHWSLSRQRSQALQDWIALTWIKQHGRGRDQHPTTAPPNSPPGSTWKGSFMKKYRTGLMLAAALGFLVSAGMATPTCAETGAVRVVFTKGGFIVGVG